MPSNRELAPYLLLVAFLVFAWIRWPDVRSSLAAIGRSLVKPGIAGTIVLFTLWCAALTYAAWRAAVWTPALSALVIIWWLSTGLPLLFTMSRFSERGHVRATLRATVGGVAVFVGMTV